MIDQPSLVGKQAELIPVVQGGHVTFDGQGTGVFQGIIKNRGDFPAQDQAAASLIGNAGNIPADMPDQGIHRRLSRRTGADHVTGKNQGQAFSLQGRDFRQRPFHPAAQHGQGVQGNIRAGPGLARRREIIGGDLTVDPENDSADLFRHLGLPQKPLGLSPGFQNLPGIGIGPGPVSDFFPGFGDEDGFFQLFSGQTGQPGVIQESRQVFDIITAQHGAQQGHGLFRVDQERSRFPPGQRRQKIGLDPGGRIHSRRHPIFQPVQQQVFASGRRCRQQPAQLSGLALIQGQGRQAQRPAVRYLLSIPVYHVKTP